MMGTFIDLVVNHPKGELLIKEAYLQLADYAKRFSANQADSELMQINYSAGIAPVVVKPDLFSLIKLAKHHSEDLHNPFNVAIGPLVKAWRIGFKDAKQPTQEEITTRLALIDPAQIILDEKKCSVFLRKAGMELDLGAIAKGYFADKVKQKLIEAGVESGFISLGGNVLTIGGSPHNSNGSWNIGIQHPLLNRGEIIRAVPLKGMSMVTSGINERFFELNSKRYHHLLDAKSGEPIATDIASLTIISLHSVDGEIWSTAGFLPQALAAIDYLNTLDGIEAILVTCQGEVMTTNGLVDIPAHSTVVFAT